MVSRTDLLNTIGVIAALLLPLTITDNTCTYTDPEWLGLAAAVFSNISYFANMYSLLGTLTASWWAVTYQVYGDVIRPTVALAIAFISMLIEQLFCKIIGSFEFDVEPKSKTIGAFVTWVVPFGLVVLMLPMMIIEQHREAKMALKERRKEGLGLVDKEDRRNGDVFNTFSAIPYVSNRIARNFARSHS